MTHADIWFDGASRGNRGPMVGGAVGGIAGKAEVLHGKPGTGTNNEAEYGGLLRRPGTCGGRWRHPHHSAR